MCVLIFFRTYADKCVHIYVRVYIVGKHAQVFILAALIFVKCAFYWCPAIAITTTTTNVHKYNKKEYK